LWDDAVKINEFEDLKKKLIEVLEKETLIKKISPFEAYCLVLKTFLDSYEHKSIGTSIIELMEKNGYKPYHYQLDAVKQALGIIDRHNGVIIADVVGLGKTVIACAVAQHLRKRGVIICPPGIIGDINRKSGWKKYTDEFGLFDWEVRSRGDLEKILEFVKEHDDIEVIIIDEAHSFRNQDTKDYAILKNICRNKIVILLTATPFNNRPGDVLSLLSLFIIPKKSSVTLDNNLVDKFRTFKGVIYRPFEYEQGGVTREEIEDKIDIEKNRELIQQRNLYDFMRRLLVKRFESSFFDELYIVNFFPTEKGAELVKSREIAQNKMFMIHCTLGEDAKIFDVDEEPSPAALYNKIQQNPETSEEESFYTKVLNIFTKIKNKHPQLIEELNNYPVRIKTAKKFNEDELFVFFKKSRLYVICAKLNDGKIETYETTLEEVFEKITCEPDEKPLGLSNNFWDEYQKVKEKKETISIPTSEQSIEKKALMNINFLLRINRNEKLIPYKNFIRTLREDIFDYGTLSIYTLRRIANLKTEESKQRTYGTLGKKSTIYFRQENIKRRFIRQNNLL